MAKNSVFIFPSSCGATPSFEMAWLTFRDRISAFSPVLKVNFGALAAISLTPSYLELLASDKVLKRLLAPELADMFKKVSMP